MQETGTGQSFGLPVSRPSHRKKSCGRLSPCRELEELLRAMPAKKSWRRPVAYPRHLQLLLLTILLAELVLLYDRVGGGAW